MSSDGMLDSAYCRFSCKEFVKIAFGISIFRDVELFIKMSAIWKLKLVLINGKVTRNRRNFDSWIFTISTGRLPPKRKSKTLNPAQWADLEWLISVPKWLSDISMDTQVLLSWHRWYFWSGEIYWWQSLNGIVIAAEIYRISLLHFTALLGTSWGPGPSGADKAAIQSLPVAKLERWISSGMNPRTVKIIVGKKVFEQVSFTQYSNRNKKVLLCIDNRCSSHRH